MFFTDRFNYREYTTAIHRERIKLEQAAYRGFSSILIIDVISAISAALGLARVIPAFTALPPFKRGGIVAAKRHDDGLIIPDWIRRHGSGTAHHAMSAEPKAPKHRINPKTPNTR